MVKGGTQINGPYDKKVNVCVQGPYIQETDYMCQVKEKKEDLPALIQGLESYIEKSKGRIITAAKIIIDIIITDRKTVKASLLKWEVKQLFEYF